VAFRAFQIELTLARGGTTTSTPVINKVVLVYERRPKVLWGFQVTVDATADYKGQTPAQQRASLETAFDTDTLVEFTFKNETDNTENHFVRVRSWEADEATGSVNEEGATIKLYLTEAQ
jgi:hypothetical protein